MPKETGWDLKIPHFEHLEISNSLNFIQGMWNYCQKFWHFLTIDFLVRNVIKETGPQPPSVPRDNDYLSNPELIQIQIGQNKINLFDLRI